MTRVRDSLTILAIALIVVLTGALVGPYLVDWSAKRGWIEARLSETLGARTQIRGPIDLKLLPSPYFVVEDIEVRPSGGERAPAWSLKVKKLRLEIAAAALLHGEVDFVEASLESPRLTLRLSRDGALPLALPEVEGRFRGDRIAIANGALRIEDAANTRSIDLDGIDIEAEAAALSGPFKGMGAFGGADARTPFRFATGPVEKGELTLKIVAEARNSRPGLELDGRLSLRPGAQRFAGAARLESAADPPWRAAGQLTLDTGKAVLDRIELRIGGPAQALSAKGQAEIDFAAAPRASATLASEEIDLDRWRAANGAGAILAFANLPAFRPPPFTLAYSAKKLILGGAAFTDVSVNLAGGEAEKAVVKQTADPGPSAWLRFEAHGPGRSRLFLDGQWRMGPEPGFMGKAQASAEDARWLKAWLSPLAPQWTPAALPFRAIDLSTLATVTPAALKLRDLVATVDCSRISGALDYRQGSGSAPSRLDADLATPSLDLGAAPGFDAPGFLARTFGAGDGSLRLEAAALTLSEAQSIGGLAINLVKTGERIELDELTFEGVDGAVITASGLLSQKKAHVDAKIVGTHDGALAALLAKIAPGPARDLVRARIGSLAPIDLSLTADTVERNSAFAIASLAALGSIGDSVVEVTVKDDPQQAGNVTISAVARAKDSLPLLRLLGLASPSVTGPGPAQIEITARGPLGGEAQTSIRASIGPASLTFQGGVVMDLTEPAAKGAFRFSSPDAAPLLRTIGLAFADFAAKLPVAGAGDLSWTKSDAALTNLKADAGGATVTGVLDFGGTPKRLTGSIDVDRMSAAALFGLVLGSPEPAKAGSLWSSLAFAPAAFDLPKASVAFAVKEVALPPNVFPRGVSAKNMRATLNIAPGLLDLRDLSLDAEGGRLGGEIRIRRAAEDASMESHLDFVDIALDGGSVRGRMSGRLDAAGTGKTPDALAASLAGSGRAVIADLVVPKADPAALARVFATFDRDGRRLIVRDIAAALASALKHADFKAESRAFDLAIAAGMLHLSPAPESAKQDAILSATFDLRRATLAQRLTYVLTPAPKDFGGAAPQITMLFQGPFSSPAVQIDAAPLANTLAARAILRESARIEAYEFDIHERAFFYERLRSERRRDLERASAAVQKAQKAPD